ncbi:hypothetical protein CCP4SC76_140001 [Gammaproteobacteria bacterium]
MEAKSFTVTFSTADKNLHVGAIRLMEMKPDETLGYIDDTGASYSLDVDSTASGPASALYAGSPAFAMTQTKTTGTHKHSVTITYPNMTVVSGIEVAAYANASPDTGLPDNMTLTFKGIDGKDYTAGKVTGFDCSPTASAEAVLNLPLHDFIDDAIDCGPDNNVYNEQKDIKAKITAHQPLTMAEFMTLWLPRSEAVQLANLIAAGKTASEISTANKALTTRYYNMAVGALLVV